ncbi:hypothetical protein MNBD_IGNAVI01-1484 [hydrothermal vent metagenome]|uniref:Uncharacterized protein n=1 Tax=hydrothermal vent metagenome TaxID=652676 RepID=A0A3B1CFB5_9ZZZZ
MIKIKFLKLLLIVFVISNVALAQDSWYYSPSLQMVGSDFQDGSNHNSFFLYNGLRYQTQSFYLSLSIPIVFGNSNTFTQLGSTYIPNGSENNDFDHGGNHTGNGGMNSTNIGFGDTYLNGSLQVIHETKFLPAFSIDGYIKFPTATASLGIGTGEFDSQIALGIRKFVNRFSFFGQFGYLFIGDAEGASTINPYTISLGVGYMFGYGKHSILLAYDSYTTIVQGFSSPKQLAFGYNYMINYGLYFTAIVSAGLNSSTSDYTISGGLNFEL